MGTGDARTGAALLAVGVANTTRSGQRRRRWRKGKVRVGLAGLFLFAAAAVALYLWG